MTNTSARLQKRAIAFVAFRTGFLLDRKACEAVTVSLLSGFQYILNYKVS
jgi:hypothetical protein